MTAIYFVFVYSYAYPYFRTGIEALANQDNLVQRLSQFGESHREIFWNIVLIPKNWVSILEISLIDNKGFIYLVRLLGAFGFLPLLGKKWLLVSLIGIFGNMLSSNPNQRTFEYHYDLSILPFLLVASADGLHRLKASSYKVYAVLLVSLFFSTRWPGHLFFKYNFNLKDGFSDSLFLSKLYSKYNFQEPIAVNYKAHAHLTSLSNLFILNHQNCRDLKLAQNPNPSLEAENFTGYIVFDQKDLCENEAVKLAFEKRQLHLIEQSPSQRFILTYVK